jgi:hypothetical protein
MEDINHREAHIALLASRNGYSQRNSGDFGFDAVQYWRLLRSWRWMIILVTAAALVGTFVVTKYVLIKQYRATVIIKAVSRRSGLAMAAGALLGGDTGVGGMLGQGLSSGTGQLQEHDPEELMAMMRSYYFTMDLLKKYNLAPHLLAGTPAGSFDRRSSEWRLYKIKKSRFSCDFDYRSELITAYFADPDSLFAQRVLGYYIDTLRGQLREQTVANATVAIQSLEAEASGTQDVFLRDGLYQLIIIQIADQKRAEMDADYSFRVIEPPIAPPEKYYPSVRKFCMLAAVISPLVMIIGLFAYGFLTSTLQLLRTLEDNAKHEWAESSSLRDGNSEAGSDPRVARPHMDREP